MRNGVYLTYVFGGQVVVGHFKLHEFEARDGSVVVDSTLIQSLEALRRDLCDTYHEDVQILITSATRTPEENEALGARLGWTDKGGLVARDSRHLVKYGGIAADFYARYRTASGYVVVGQDVVGDVAREHFNYVRSDYLDGHVHGDNRSN